MRKRNFRSVLEEIPGVGEGRKKRPAAPLRLAQAGARGDHRRARRGGRAGGGRAHPRASSTERRARTEDDAEARDDASLEDAAPRSRSPVAE